MTAPTRTRSRSHTSARRQPHRARGGASPRLVVFGTVAVIALIVGALVGGLFFRPASPKPKASASVNSAGAPAVEVALPTEDNPGPVRMNGLAPSGFTTGATGASAAAVAYAQAVVQLTTHSAAEVDAAGRSMVAPRINANAAVGTTVEGLRSKIRPRSDTVLRVVPLGRKLGPTTGNRMAVDVWVGVLSASPSGTPVAGGVIPTPTELNFFTVSAGLVYVGGDWKLESLRFAEGPTPAMNDNAPMDAAQFGKTMQSYLPYGYLPPQEVTK